MATQRIRPVGHEDRLTIVEHLDELRTRLIACIAVFILVFAVCYSQNHRLLNIVNQPLYKSQNVSGQHHTQDPLEQSARFELETGRAAAATSVAMASIDKVLQRAETRSGLSPADRVVLRASSKAVANAAALQKQAAEATPTNRHRLPVTLGVTEPFVTTFTIAGYAALLLTLPFILFQAYAFVLPAFSERERRVALPLMVMVPVLFACGVTFGYFVALPRAVNFLQNFNDSSFDILIRATDYYRFSIILLAMIGLLFQIPVGVLAVTRMGLISARQLAKNRGYVILGLAVLAAVATPTPDPVTMLIAMAPLVVLFELSVLLARIFERRRDPKTDEDWDPDDKLSVS